LALWRVGVTLARLQRPRGPDCPDTVVPQAPEGVLRVVGPSGRAEILEQDPQVLVDLGEGDVGPFPPGPPPEGGQDQGRPGGGALAAAAPDVKPAELLQD